MNKNLICDIETGVCGTEGDIKINFKNLKTEKIDFYYFTDPLCAHCYLLEPIVKKFTHVYKDHLNVKVIMGGLLEKWGDLNDPEATKPSDLYYHWQEINKIASLPLDGRLWLDDYITSSFPASQVYEVIKKIDAQKADTFLRQARVQTFAFNQNISNDEVLIKLVDELGLNGKQIVLEEIKNHGKELLDEGFYTARSFGVTGYPTIIMVNDNNDGIVFVGSRSFEEYKNALLELISNKNKITKNELPKLQDYLYESKVLFFSEIQEMYNLKSTDIETFIENNLNNNTYEINEVLNKKYIKSKSEL